jgi:hypothetical protein
VVVVVVVGVGAGAHALANTATATPAATAAQTLRPAGRRRIVRRRMVMVIPQSARSADIL